MTRVFALFLGVLWLGGLVLFDLAFVTREESLRAQVDRVLSEVFSAKVRYAGFEGSWSKSLRLTGLEIAHPQIPERKILEADEVLIDLDWDALLEGENPLQGLRLRGAVCHLSWVDGALDLASPLAPDLSGSRSQRPELAGPAALPTLELKGLRVELHDPPFRLLRTPVLDWPDLTAKLLPAHPDTDAAYRVEVGGTHPWLGAIDAKGLVGTDNFQLSIESEGELQLAALREVLDPEALAAIDGFEMAGHVQTKSEVHKARSDDALSWKTAVALSGFRAAVEPWDFPFEEVGGSIRASSTDRLRVELGGLVAGTRFSTKIETDPRAWERTSRLELDLPLLQLEQDFLDRLDLKRHPKLPAKIGVVRGELDRFEVRGPVSLHVEARADPDLEDGVWFLARMEPRGMRFRYMGDLLANGERINKFPYQVHGVHGRVWMDNKGLVLEDVGTVGQPFEVRAFGVADIRDSVNESYGIVIEAEDVEIEQQLLDALKPSLRDIVTGLRPEGSVDARITVSRMTDEPLAQPALVEVWFEDVRLKPDALPVPLTAVSGRVRGGDGMVTFEEMRGHLGGAVATFSGSIGTSEEDFHVDLDAQASEVVIDQRLRDGLAVRFEDLSRGLERVGFEGTIDRLQLNIERPRVGGRLSVEGTVIANDLVSRPADQALVIPDMDLALGVEPVAAGHELTLLEGSSAEFAGLRLALTGGVRGGGSVDLLASVDGAAFGDRFLDGLAPLVPELADPAKRPQVRGVGDFRLRVTEGRGGEPTVGALIDIRDGFFRSSPQATMALRGLEGLLQYRDDEIVLENLRAELAPADSDPGGRPARLRAAQVRMPLDDADPTLLSMRELTVDDLPMAAWFLEGLGLVDAEEPLDLTGTASLSASMVRVPRGEDGATIRDGRIEVRDLRVGEGGEVAIKALVIEDANADQEPLDAWRLDGLVHARGAEIGSVELPQFEADFELGLRDLKLRGFHAALFREPDAQPFDESTPDHELVPLVVAAGLLTEAAATKRDDEALRVLLRGRAQALRTDQDEAQLRRAALRAGLVGPRRLARMDFEALQRLVEERGHERFGGRVVAPSRVDIDFDEKAYDASFFIEPLSIRNLIGALGGGPTEIGGRLRGQVEIQGILGDPDSRRGRGVIAATVRNLFEVPAFFEVLRGLDLLAVLDSSPWARARASFSIDGAWLNFPAVSIQGQGLRLTLAEPARIGLNGEVRARLQVRSIGRTPLLGQLVELVPRTFVRQVAIDGTLDEPKVSVGEGDPPR